MDRRPGREHPGIGREQAQEPEQAGSGLVAVRVDGAAGLDPGQDQPVEEVERAEIVQRYLLLARLRPIVDAPDQPGRFG